jgi:hypothetical protein
MMFETLLLGLTGNLWEVRPQREFGAYCSDPIHGHVLRRRNLVRGDSDVDYQLGIWWLLILEKEEEGKRK